METDNPTQVVFAYHERTKHHPDRYAASPGYLDWETQPDPFRRHDGAPLLPLPVALTADGPRWDDLFNIAGVALRPLDRESVAQFFQDALGLSALKEYEGARWSLRVNPSSGNLHPTEGYLLAGPVQGLHPAPALYHYAPQVHGLEMLREVPDSLWNRLSRQLPPGAFLVGLTSIHWRESWKYGERAFRYCQHDVGHALGALAVSAAVLGWRARLLETAGDTALSALLGVDRQRGIEAERPDCLVAVYPGNQAFTFEMWRGFRLPPELIKAMGELPASGTPNTLSSAHREWPVIDAVSAVAEHAEVPGEEYWSGERNETEPLAGPVRPCRARAIIRQRRSAVAMDEHTRMECAAFFAMLSRTLPGRSNPVFAVAPWRPMAHLLLFVHRVRGLAPGLYLLVRDMNRFNDLKGSMRKEFLWERAEGCPGSLPLFLLAKADVAQAALMVSCNQEIASDGAFAVGMLAEFEAPIMANGAWFYRRLFWESGMVGQLLYLEAEAAGLRGTGIGCFFDDMVHQLLGLVGLRWQSLYHFTVGGHVEDLRVRTLSPETYFAGHTVYR
ncbi:MAG: SagB/ThcOx family dehydrogenase [Candidatus Hydrogenedentes bacterium]|nr:SagB/ThcOx family dehydrogenase [Candidatus Hydrogenedentota bacterium]